MRHLLFLALAKAFFLLFVSFGSLAQSLPAQDYLVLHSGDTLYGTVQYISSSNITARFYKKIRLRDARGRQRKIHRKK